MTNVCLFGVFADSSLSSERYNLFIGGIKLEGTLSVIGTSTSFWNDLSTLSGGRVFKLNDVFYVHGGITVGSTTGSVATDVSDSKKKVVFTEKKYYRGTQWYSTMSGAVGGLSFIDGASSSTRLVDGTLIVNGLTKFGVYYAEGFADSGTRQT